MKKLIFTVLAIFTIATANSQVIPIAGIEFYTSNTKTIQSFGFNGKIDQGEIALTSGLGYRYKFVEATLIATTWCNKSRITSYRPVSAEYVASMKIHMNKVYFKIEHMCTHPIKNYREYRPEYFAGYTKIGIYYEPKR